MKLVDPSTETHNTIRLPLTILLTDSGREFFLERRKRLGTVETVLRGKGQGIEITEYTEGSILQLLKRGYAAQLEVAAEDYLSARDDFLRISRLLGTRFVFSELNNRIAAALCASAVVTEWNRFNPTAPIEVCGDTEEDQILFFLHQNRENLSYLKRRFRELIVPGDPEGMTPASRGLEDALNHVGPMIWYHLLQFQSFDRFGEVLTDISRILATAEERAAVSEYLSLVLVELVMLLQNRNMIGLAEQLGVPGYKIDTGLRNRTVRNNLLARLAQTDARIHVVWRIRQGYPGSAGKNGAKSRFEVSIFNSHGRSDEIRHFLERKTRMSGGEQNLEDFYEKFGEDAGAELGLSYISFLTERCRSLRMYFDCQVRSTGKKDQEIITLIFRM
ncbi:MAG: hypothetical protein ACOCYA_03540 [Spirochaetota bacterium]